MDFLDALFGGTRPPPSKEDRIFAMSTALVALQAAGLEPDGRVGLLFRRLPAARFAQLESDVKQLLELQAEGEFTVETVSDELGFDWLVLVGEDFQTALAAQHTVASQFQEEGVADLLLACLFRFLQAGRPVYFVYAYKRSAFYPFVPAGDHRRDNETELRLAAIAKPELPIDPDVEAWYPVWGAPV